MNKIKSQRGQAIILIALAVVGLVGFAALAIDGGRVLSDKRHAQNAADTAAFAAALAKIQGQNYTTAAINRAASNGYNNGSNVTVEVHLCNETGITCQGVPTGANLSEYIQVKITSVVQTTFARSGELFVPGSEAAGTQLPPSVDVGSPSPVIPDHELLRLIGRGAYGEVWMARNAIGTLRAVKIVHRRSFQRAEQFEREFKGLLKFEPISRSHDGLVDVLQIGRRDDAGYFFYVMELADAAKSGVEDGGLKMEDGEDSKRGASHSPFSILDLQNYEPRTLRSELRARNPLPPAECVTLGLKLAAALEHLHANGLVHRDIKPSNIIFVQGEPKLADIGLVTAIDEAQSLVGTVGYIPPEGPGTPQADLYSLGKVFYEIAFGKDRQDFPQLPPDLQSHPDYAALLELNEVILKACETDPRRRYASATALREDLELLQRGQSVKQKRTRQQRWAVAKKVLVASAVLGVLAMAGTFLWQQWRLTRPLSKNPQAEQLYQEAVYELKSYTLERRLQAYTNLTEAIKLDPGFVEAYYGLVQVNFDDSLGSKLPPHFNHAANWRAAVAKLREVNPNSVQYHTANSGVKFMDWKFEEAIEESALAVRLDPKFWMAHGAYAWCVLFGHGDADTALREYRIAERLNPSDPVIQFLMADAFSMERKFDLAIKQLNKALQLEPRNNSIHVSLAVAYEADKQYDKALDEFEQFDLLRGQDTETTKAWYQKLRSELHENGPRGWWQAVLDEHRNNPAADPYWDAKVNARLGNTNEVFTLLERAYQQHNGNMDHLLLDDCFDPVQGDPRFKELVRKMGLRPIGVAAR